MKVGVTGSRNERPQSSVDRLRSKLIEVGATELHHGDCNGWDKQANDLARSMGLRTVSHPPTNESHRAHCECDEELPPADYLVRNKNIVNAVGFMIAAPDKPEHQRSGTWSTVRYAKSRGVRGVVLPWGQH